LSEEADIPPPPPKASRKVLPRAVALVGVAILVLLLAVLATARYGVLLPQARLLIEARTDGLRMGRIGRLKIEGLSGDIWRDAHVRRLTIRDERGAWLQADNVHLTWRYSELLRRRFVADTVTADRVTILRRPTLEPKSKDRGLPVSFHIDDARTRLVMEPAFSYQRGVYDVALRLDVERGGGQSGALKAFSLLHPGDHLTADFDLRKHGTMRVVADAEEARGGALAGALGLAPDQPFKLTVRIGGETSAGRVLALATSGARTPLQVRGAWTPQGGQAGGRLLLAASTLTAPYAERFGPEVRFGLAGRKAAEGVYALDFRIISDALTIHASGPGDLGKRRLSRQGVRIAARAPSLSRITGGPKTGAAVVNGVLTGEASAWRFAGTGALNSLDLGGYALAQVSGPIELAAGKGGYLAKARLAGFGGKGEGFAAALLGGRPMAAFEGERLANGQLLLRRLDLTGSGLTVKASGGRSLLGALDFKGDAKISNLKAARIGASGGADLEWRASQAKAAAPWTITLDAQGDRLALGLAELDRLLGPRPRLRAQANWQDGRLAIAKADLDGASLNGTLAGVMEANGALAFKTGWTASGPVRAGPVEITGGATGTGTVGGALSAPKLDLVAEFQQIDVPRLPLQDAKLVLSFQRLADGSSGSFGLTARSSQGPASASSAFRFPRGGLELRELALDAGGVKAEGSLSLRSLAPSAADLRVSVGPGVLLEAGQVKGTVKIVDAAGGPRAALDLRAQNARPTGTRFQIRSAALTADGPLSNLPYVAMAQGGSQRGAWKLDGRGKFTDVAGDGYAVTFDGSGKLGARELRTVEAASFRFGGPERSARLRLASSDGGRIDLDGLLRGDAAEVKARVAGLGLGMFDPDLAGRIDGTLTMQGAGARLAGSFDVRLADARGRGSPEAQGLDATLRGRAVGDTLTVEAVATNEQGLKSQANLVLPIETSAAPFRISTARLRPMRGTFSAEGEVRPLWALVVGGERALSGYVRTQGTLGGTMADPEVSGHIAVERGRFDDGATGLSLRDVALQAGFSGDSINVSEVRGVDGHGGQASGQGRISLLRDGVSTFRLDLRGFRLIDNEQATAAATGQATINRAADGKVKLAGALTIDRADVAADPPQPSGVVPMDVKEINRPDDLQDTLPAAYKRGAGWALDVTLKAPRRIFVRGRGLDVELSLDAHVGGTTSSPDLTGTARVVRGDYDFAGKRFEFDERSVVYLSTRPQNIRLQLDATRDDPTLSVTVRIRGNAAKPEITLASSPSLPNDEILSKVLFERSASQLSSVEAAQLAAALSTLRGGGGFDILGNLRSFAGVDRLAFGGAEGSGVTVSGGKYLTEDVYLELTGGGREGPSAQVEWRIRKSLSILSRFAGQAGNRIAVRWRKDY
jgi:translocation and assembly module TamB